MEQDRNIPQEVKERLDIVDVISPYVKLRKAGKNYSGVCPFHNEKTPSFIVSPEIQRYKCFGCGKSGDIITFIQEIETLDFPEALKKLAKDAGIQYQPGRRNSRNQALEKINEEALLFFSSQLKNNSAAKEYLNKRGITQELVETFKIGFAPGYNQLLKHISTTQKSKALLLQTGLFTEKNGAPRDKFINRVMFPIWSNQGKVVGFSGRQLPGDDFGPKYLNSPETPIFQKRNTLFSIYHSKGDIKKEDLCILCEGQIDVISAFKLGIRNIVAPLGTGLTDAQLLLIKKYTDKLLLFFDNDDAGQKAIERAFLLASPLEFTIYCANPEPYQDLDDLIQKAPDELQIKLKGKMEAYVYLLIKMLEKVDLDSLEGRKELAKYHHYLTDHVKDNTVKSYYIEKFKEITKIDLQKSKVQKYQRSQKQQTANTKQYKGNRQESLFLTLVIQNDLLTKVAKIDPKYFSDPTISEIITIVSKQNYDNVEQLYADGTLSESQRNTIEKATFEYNSYPVFTNPNHTLNELYLKIQVDYFKNLREKLREKLIISEEKGNNVEAREISEEINKINLELSEIEKRASRL